MLEYFVFGFLFLRKFMNDWEDLNVCFGFDIKERKV